MTSLLCSAVICTACATDPAGVEGESIVKWPGSVSNVVIRPASSAMIGAAAVDGSDQVAYVSLPPGTIPYGDRVAIHNDRLGTTVTVKMVEGGFDPVAITGQAGDSLHFYVDRTGGLPLLTFAARLVLRVRPRVVRTDPPPRKRDIPLRVSPLVVFSEPIDEAVLGSDAIRLLRNGVAVPGDLAFVGPDQISIAFVPDAPLEAATTYVLEVTTKVRDRTGEPLDAPASIEFTTAAAVPLDFSRIVLRLESDVGFVGMHTRVGLEARDAADTFVSTEQATVTSSNPAVAELVNVEVIPTTYPTGQTVRQLLPTFALVGPGTTTIAVTLGNLTQSIPLHVLPLPPASTALAVDTFTVVEYAVSCAWPCPYLAYSPILKLREPTGTRSVEVVAVRFTVATESIGWCRGLMKYAPGESAHVNRVDPYLWANDLIVVSLNGTPLPDGLVTARVILRDSNGDYGGMEVQGSIQRMVAFPDLPLPQPDGPFWTC